MWVGTEMPRDFKEFHYIQPPFPGFVFGDEGLVLAKPISELLLRKLRLFTGSDKGLNEAPVLFRSKRLVHAGNRGLIQGANRVNPKSELSQNRILPVASPQLAQIA